MNKALALLYSPWFELKRILFGVRHSAMVDITDNCNLRCDHCYHFRGKDEFNKSEEPVSVWNERFMELYRGGTRFILLLGGEPALRTDILMLADSIFPFVYVITNGTISIPKEFNHRLFVSLDGGKKTNDDIRGVGVYDLVLKNFSEDPRVIINMTLSTDNYMELEHVVKTSLEHKLRGVVCNICTYTLGDSNPLPLSREARKPISSELKRVKKKYPGGLILTSSMINWYAEPDHSDYCYWGDKAHHFDSSWNRRRCFANTDCSNCGCLGGAFQSPRHWLMHPREMLRLM